MFSLEADHGDVVRLYLVPDSASAVATIIARSQGRNLLALSANETRPVLVDAGRHLTGECGFRLDETLLPGLAAMDDLELYEAETRTLVYRRRDVGHVERKVLRIETHLFPLWRLDDSLKPRFQYFARGVDALGRETTTQLFQLSHANSVYVSGRVLYNAYRHYIDTRRFGTIFVMHHPYEEMAERLLVLGQIKKLSVDVLGMRDSLSLTSTIAFAQSLPLHDEAALVKALHAMPTDVAQTLVDPVTRQLTTRAPDEHPPRRALASALDALASFTVLGLRRDPASLLSAVGELALMDPAQMPPLAAFPHVTPLARALKRSRIVEVLLERDLELYNYIANAFKKTK